MASFSERLKELRIEKRLTQEKLADKFYLNKSSISRYERGQQVPELELLQQIADFFSVSTDYLLGNSDIRNPYTNSIKTNDEEELTPEEIELLETIKNDPELSILFHDLKSAPKKKIKQLLDTWEFVNKQFDDMEKNADD